APAGHEIVSGHGRIAPGCAAGDVVEVRGVAGRNVLGVDRWVDEADGRFAVVGQLLVDQGNVASPHGSGETGTAIVVSGASGLVGADVEGKVRVCRDVGAVAQGR